MKKSETHRVYLRHAHQRTSTKTATDDVMVAEYAFSRLVAEHAGDLTAVAHTRDSTQIKYVRLNGTVGDCPKCGVKSWIDLYCWECRKKVDAWDSP